MHKVKIDFKLQLKEAWNNLFSAKLRSCLAILGILMGTASVVAMVSSGQLATQQALQQFKKLGTNLLSVSMYTSSNSATPKQKVSLRQIADIKEQIANINYIAPYTNLYTEISYNGNKINGGNVIGTTAELMPIIKLQLQQGRFISYLDKTTFFCVLGYNVYQQLKSYMGNNPVGNQIRLGKNIFTVIGVLDQWEQNSFFNQNINDSVIINLPTSRQISKYASINNIIMRLKSNTNVRLTSDTIKAYLNKHFHNRSIFIRNSLQLIESMKKQRAILTLLLGLIGGISLLVGGIGVMNIMLVSVVERKREIGIRMALGARRKDIRSLFLIEAINLALFGGTLGVIIGILTSYIVAMFSHWDFTIFVMPPTIGFAVSVAVGIFFGFYPAYQASRLDPIQTLRSD